MPLIVTIHQIKKPYLALLVVCVCVCVCVLVTLTLCDPMDCSPVSPLSMGFSRQEYWAGLPFPTLGIFLIQGSNPHLLHLLRCQACFFFNHCATWEAPLVVLKAREKVQVLR